LPEEDKEGTTFEEFIREDYEWHLILMEERRQFEKYWSGFTKS